MDLLSKLCFKCIKVEYIKGYQIYIYFLLRMCILVLHHAILTVVPWAH